jgi:hypothetical protein
MFEVVTGPRANRFHPETVRRTPWTRRFFPRGTEGPDRQPIANLIEWTRQHWPELVLKPDRGYSGRGVRVGGVHEDADEAVELACREGHYIVQEKIPLHLWAEDNPVWEPTEERVRMERFQTDFRCLFGPKRVFGFLVRFGGVPTNVGCGGGVQPLAVLRSDVDMADAVRRINEALCAMPTEAVAEAVSLQQQMALDQRFTYLLGPIRVALRPRLVTEGHLAGLADYCRHLWNDCLTLERMWLEGELDEYVDIEEEELAICRSQPWGGSPAVFAADGLFSFGAHPEKP